MNRRINKLNLLRLSLAATALLFVGLFYAANSSSASGEKPKNYRVFSHKVNGHDGQCNSCHQTPSENSFAVSGYPNITDYPDHDSCLDCHRQQFFAGARPQICSICHTTVSPRAKARFGFPAPKRKSEFNIEFPHNVHQDIIASVAPSHRRSNRDDLAVAHFVRASFAPAAASQTPVASQTPNANAKAEFNNCAICHRNVERLPRSDTRQPSPGLVPVAPIDAATQTADAKFYSATLNKDFFKGKPENHAACFNCHYEAQKPISSDCRGCHVPARAHFESNTAQRFTLKFNHNEEQFNDEGKKTDDPHNKDCTVCHVQATQVADLRDPRLNNITLTSCGGSCHAAKINEEIMKRDESVRKNENVYACTYCHTSDIGIYAIPDSHRGIK